MACFSFHKSVSFLCHFRFFTSFSSSCLPWIHLSHVTRGSLSHRVTDLKSHLRSPLCPDTQFITSACPVLSEIPLLPATFVSALSYFFEIAFKLPLFFHFGCQSSQHDKDNITFRLLSIRCGYA